MGVDCNLSIVVLLLHFQRLVRQIVIVVLESDRLSLHLRPAAVRRQSLILLVARDVTTVVFRPTEILASIVALLIAGRALLTQPPGQVIAPLGQESRRLPGASGREALRCGMSCRVHGPLDYGPNLT